MSSLLFAPLVLAAGAVCAFALGRGPGPSSQHRFAVAPTPAAAAPAALTAPPIARLVTLDRVLTIRAGTESARFDVEDREGHAVADGLDEAALRERFPDLYEIVDPVRGARAYLDASLDHDVAQGHDAKR